MDHPGTVLRGADALGGDQVAPVDEKRGIEGLAPDRRDVGLVTAAGLVEGRAELVRAMAKAVEVPGLGAVFPEGEDRQPDVRPEPVNRVEHRRASRGRREQDQVRRAARRSLASQVLSDAAGTGAESATAYPAAPPVIDSAIA